MDLPQLGDALAVLPLFRFLFVLLKVFLLVLKVIVWIILLGIKVRRP
jgi:hypothetical protein